MRHTLMILILAGGLLPQTADAATCPIPPQATDDTRTFFVCHPDGTYWSVGKKKEWKELPSGATLRVPSGKTQVKVQGTNTALYRYELSSEAVESPEGKQLNSFLKKFGPYLVAVPSTQIGIGQAEVAQAFTAVKAPSEDLTSIREQLEEATAELIEDLKPLEKALQSLEKPIDDIRDLRIDILRAYGTEDATALREKIEAICGDPAACRSRNGCRKACSSKIAQIVNQLLTSYGNLGKLIADDTTIQNSSEKVRRLLDEAEKAATNLSGSEKAGLDLAIRDAKKSLDLVPKLLDSARKALDEAGEVIEQARTLERLLFDGLGAKSTWTSPPFPLTLENGRKVTLKISRRPVAAIASAGHLPDVATTFTLQPRWPLQPAVGLSLLHAEGATFPVFGTKKVEETIDGVKKERFQIVEKEIEDERFAYGLTLGLTNEHLCVSERSCLWLDLTVDPSDDLGGLGAGLSMSMGRMRLGVGALWTKHSTLTNGLELGQLLDAEGDLKTGESYGDPNFYVSFSISGWQPFVAD